MSETAGQALHQTLLKLFFPRFFYLFDVSNLARRYSMMHGLKFPESGGQEVLIHVDLPVAGPPPSLRGIAELLSS